MNINQPYYHFSRTSHVIHSLAGTVMQYQPLVSLVRFHLVIAYSIWSYIFLYIIILSYLFIYLLLRYLILSCMDLHHRNSFCLSSYLSWSYPILWRGLKLFKLGSGLPQAPFFKHIFWKHMLFYNFLKCRKNTIYSENRFFVAVIFHSESSDFEVSR